MMTTALILVTALMFELVRLASFYEYLNPTVLRKTLPNARKHAQITLEIVLNTLLRYCFLFNCVMNHFYIA